jgi:SAM-dependent methyltransferase
MTTAAELTTWLTQQKLPVERFLCSSLATITDDYASLPTFERQSSFNDLLNLSNNEDAMYDRPSTGLSYALWYQAKRLQDAVRGLTPLLLAHDDDLTVIDIGCGTGAALLAIVLIEEGRVKLGAEPRQVTINALEPSIPMLEVAQKWWTHIEDSPFDTSRIQVEFSFASFSAIPRAEGTCIAYAGYLFDSSDKERAFMVGSALARALKDANVSDLMIAWASMKNSIVRKSLDGIFESKEWARGNRKPTQQIWDGLIRPLIQCRKIMAADCDSSMQHYANNAPGWFYQYSQFQHIRRSFVTEDQLDLGEGRSPFILDETQDSAAHPKLRLTAIIGAAGSGKSRVLVERLSRLVKLATPAKPQHILVTCFNKGVTAQLAEWFEESMAQSTRQVERVDRLNDGGYTRYKAGETWSVLFMNWDRVPTRIFDLSPNISDGAATIRKSIKTLPEKLKSQWEQRPQLTPEFIDDEHRRVIYGLGAHTLGKYLNTSRKGRKTALFKPDRELVWKILENRPALSFTDTRLQALLSILEEDSFSIRQLAPKRFTSVFVDEVQDFLPADLKLLESLLEDKRKLCVFGDSLQAMHIGMAFDNSTMLGGRRWKTWELSGSYRLPIRICEALLPLADAIAMHRESVKSQQISDEVVDEDEQVDLVRPHAVKSAVLGVRPIVLAGSKPDIRRQLAEVVRHYSMLFDPAHGSKGIITVAEYDKFLKEIFDRLKDSKKLPEDVVIEAASMSKIKGLERPLVAWSTQTDIPRRETEAEWVYTVLTRTTGVVVIAISQNTDARLRSIVGRLREDRLMFWSEKAHQEFRECQKMVGTSHDPLA